jgi:AcrR family transcriptional regulator
VAQPTVYKLFRNKRALLSAIADEWIGQVGIGQLQPAASPREAIAGWAATIRRQWELGLDIGLVYAGAVTSEPEVEAELQPRLAARERAIRAVAASLRPGLRPGVTVEGAIAVISALSLPEVYRELVRDRRWSPRAFQRWLEGTLAALLLQPD